MRKFKTLKGFLKSIGYQPSMDMVLDGRIMFKSSRKVENFELSEAALKEVAEMLAEKWSKGYRKKVVAKVMAKDGDNSYLQCFIIERTISGKYWVGNCSNGDASNYCKRMWLKS